VIFGLSYDNTAVVALVAPPPSSLLIGRALAGVSAIGGMFSPVTSPPLELVSPKFGAAGVEAGDGYRKYWIWMSKYKRYV